MTFFIRNGNNFNIMADGSIDIKQSLEPGNYVVRADGVGNLFLELIKPFELPNKLYGDLESTGKRILATYSDRRKSTGVLLMGEKGSGKTLLAEYLSVESAKNDVPTILVNQCFNGEALNSLISRIDQPAVVFFDEFEKNYPSGRYSDSGDPNEQEKLLTLLDGVYKTKKLFVLTCNDEDAIDKHFINRPGRIYYYKRFTGLEDNFISEYIEDRLNKDVSQQFKNELLYRIRLMGCVNFDMLQAIVEEANRYPNDVMAVFAMLNVGMADNHAYDTSIKLVDSEVWVSANGVDDPLHDDCIAISVNQLYHDDRDKVLSERRKKKLPLLLTFKNDDITNVDADGTMLFINVHKDELRLKKRKPYVGGHMTVGYRG